MAHWHQTPSSHQLSKLRSSRTSMTGFLCLQGRGNYVNLVVKYFCIFVEKLLTVIVVAVCQWVWPCQNTIRKRWWCDWCLDLKWTCQMFLHKRRCHKEMMDDWDFTSSTILYHRRSLFISIAIQYRGMNGINIMLMLSSICILINIIWDLTTIFFLLL